MPSDAEIAKSRRDPVKLAQIILNLDKLIELNDQTQHTTKMLRWEFSRQLQLHSSKFWLEDFKGPQLIKIFNEWNAEYRIVFGKPSPFIYGSPSQGAKDWKWRQRKNFDDAKINT